MASSARLRVVGDPGDPVERIPAELVSKEERAHQGTGDFVRWCPTCEENAIPMGNGACAFCDTPLVPLDHVAAGAEQAPEPDLTPPEHVEVRGPSSVPRVQNSPEAPARAPEDQPVLTLGPSLAVPLNAATESLAILAVKGAGKSNAAAVLVEEFYDVGVAWVVIDPKGDWWGIAKSEANPEGLPIPVFGGIERPGQRHIPLGSGSGAHIAKMIVEHNLTCVLDISHMDDEDRSEFLADLGETLFEQHLHHQSVRHIVIEEAHEVIPQSGGLRKTIKAWTRVVTQGRQRGIGITLVSQRSALVNKNVLNQSGSLFVLRTTSPHDKKTIREWTDFHEVGAELVKSLPSLKNGEAWIVAPHWLGRVDRVRLRRRWTHDSGKTPETVAQPSQVLSEDDITAFAEQLNGPAKPQGLPVTCEFSDGAIKRSPEDIILMMVKRRPQRRGELREAIGLSDWKTGKLIGELRAEGLIRKVGDKGGAKYAEGPGDEFFPSGSTEAPQDVTGEPPIEFDDAPELAASAVEDLSRTAREAMATLQKIDRQAEESGLAEAILRGRYLALLFKRIEDGDHSPELLDRFERVAGLVEG